MGLISEANTRASGGATRCGNKAPSQNRKWNDMDEPRNDIPVNTTPQSATDGGLAPNLAGALAYITIIPAIIFLALAPYNRDRFVRFHAWQSLVFGILVFIIDVGLTFIPFMGWIIRDLLGLLFFILWVIAVLKAFQGQEWKIPVVGDLAVQQANKGAL